MTDSEITFEHVLPQIHHTCIFQHDTYHRYSPTDWQQVWVGAEYPVKPELVDKLEKAFQKFRYS